MREGRSPGPAPPAGGMTVFEALARAGSTLPILSVTVLTSYDDAALAAAGYVFSVPRLVAERAPQARDVARDERGTPAGRPRGGCLMRFPGRQTSARRRCRGSGQCEEVAARHEACAWSIDFR